MVYTSQLPGRSLLKPSEVASLFGVSPQTVYNWHRMGMIHGVKISGVLRIYASSLGEMIQ